jgi:hypothetical protein
MLNSHQSSNKVYIIQLNNLITIKIMILRNFISVLFLISCYFHGYDILNILYSRKKAQIFED